MSFFSDADVKKGMIAGAFGLIGTLLPVVLSWSRDRDAASTRQRKIDEATKRIAFWEQWLKLSCQVDTSGNNNCAERVHKELVMLGEIIERDSLLAHTQNSKLIEKTSQFTEHVNVLPAWRRIFLFYKPERSLAWFPRIMFYCGLLFFVLFLAVQIKESKSVDPSAFEGLFLFELMTIVWCAVFRYLSRFLEQPHGPSITNTSAIPPPPKV